MPSEGLSRVEQHIRACWDSLQDARLKLGMPSFEEQYGHAQDVEIVPLAVMEKRMILAAMARENGNIVHVARKLGITKKTVYRKLYEYGHPRGSELAQSPGNSRNECQSPTSGARSAMPKAMGTEEAPAPPPALILAPLSSISTCPAA
jgi:hypothetical protein